MQDEITFALYAVVSHQFRIEGFVCSQTKGPTQQAALQFFPSVLLVFPNTVGRAKNGFGGKCVA